jgi:hypothetical protein
MSTLWRGEISLAYNAFYIKSLSYGTPGTPLSFKECNNMQKPLFNFILPKMVINRNAERPVVFGTAQYGRMGLDHLETVQNYGQLQYLIGSHDTAGQLIRTMLEYAELEGGCSKNVLGEEYNIYAGAIIDKNWITEIWAQLALHKANLQVKRLWTLEKEG